MIFFVNILRKLLKIYYTAPLLNHPKSFIGKNLRLGDIHYFELNQNAEKITIGDDVKLNAEVNITVGNNAKLEIGEKTFFNKYTSIVALESISIGENCLFGENVKIYDNNHKIDIFNGVIKTNHYEFSTSPVKIGNNVWLATNVTVLKGVTIGDNVVIGAGCVIHKDVPANSVIVNKQELILR